MTHRQYEVVQAWLEAEWNRPSRSDYYLMQIGCEVLRGRVRKPKSVQMKHLKLAFQVAQAPRKPLTREEAAAAAKARWVGLMGMPVRVVKG